MKAWIKNNRTEIVLGVIGFVGGTILSRYLPQVYLMTTIIACLFVSWLEGLLIARQRGMINEQAATIREAQDVFRKANATIGSLYERAVVAEACLQVAKTVLKDHGINLTFEAGMGSQEDARKNFS